MDFQGQGKALTGETEALAIVDATARYVVVIPLRDRSATTFIPPFLDQVIFRQGAPDILHSDAAQEFLSEALELLATAAQIETTTALGHNAAGNSLIEVFWRYWNRCMRILPDDLYSRWPELASRICFAYNTAPHSSLGNVSPFEVYHGVPARNPFAPSIPPPNIDLPLPQQDLTDPAGFATAVKMSQGPCPPTARRPPLATAARLDSGRIAVAFPWTTVSLSACGRRPSDAFHNYRLAKNDQNNFKEIFFALQRAQNKNNVIDFGHFK